MRLVSMAAALLAVWGLSVVPLMILWRRKLFKEFWVTIGYLTVATASIVLLGLEVRPQSVLRVLSEWFWIPG